MAERKSCASVSRACRVRASIPPSPLDGAMADSGVEVERIAARACARTPAPASPPLAASAR